MQMLKETSLTGTAIVFRKGILNMIGKKQLMEVYQQLNGKVITTLAKLFKVSIRQMVGYKIATLLHLQLLELIVLKKKIIQPTWHQMGKIFVALMPCVS